MYNTAGGWLMTNLTTDVFVVSLVQVANNLPMFMFALPGGALSDIVDKRRFLLVAEIISTILSAIFAAMVWFHHVTPTSLLWFMFLIGAAGAVTFPAWQAVVPQLVSRKALPSAISANSAGVNVSRAVGPALAGAIIGPLGIAAPFVVNAVSDLGVIGALAWWREPKSTASALPVERLTSAIRTGFRYARNNPSLRATLIRTVAFFLFASTYWALLPVVARNRMSGGPEIYGVLLGAIGLGAVGGAFALPSWNARVGPDRLVAASSLGTALALVLFGLAREPMTAVLASIIAGVCWITVIATLNVSAQVALPDWVRGRGLAIYVTVLFGSMTLGSAIWGQVAGMAGLPVAHFLAAAGVVLAIPLTWRWKLQTGDELDLTPSMQWPTPILSQEIAASDGPVLVTIEYRIAHDKDRKSFLVALNRLRRERLRDGAYEWGIFEATDEPGRFLETFLVESWLEHLRQHERVTSADYVLQQYVYGLLKETPKVTHFIAPAR
jgi:MFS family permease